ncbi:MAG: cytochrome c3 family protein [bacterium]|nr:cytochrome c3 family protein [bacterium]
MARSVMPGSSKQECAVCHYEWHPDHSIKDNPDRIPRYIGHKRYVTDEWICYSCHDGSMVDSRAKVWKKKITHPTKIVPSKKVNISEKYPLYFMNNFAYKDDSDKFYGELDCGSCHTAHAVGSQDGSVPERATYLREANENSEMCMDCHKDKSNGTKEGMHPINVESIVFPKELKESGAYSGDKANKVICESCHKIHSAEADNLLLLPVKGPDVKSSELCEACHTNNPSKKEGPGHDTHPVDVPQTKASIPYRWHSGKPSNTGKNNSLICVSCHSPHYAAKETHLLADNNKKSSFCEICHIDKLNKGTGEKNTGTHPVDVQLTGEMHPMGLQFGPDSTVICESCHKVHNAADNAANDGTDGKIMAVSNKNSALCLECHETKYANGIQDGEQKGTHPINVIPSEAVISPSLLGLGARKGVDEKLVCESCHKIHDSAPKTKNLLADNKFSGLCNTCHQNKIIRGIRDSIASIKHPVNIISDKVKIAEDIIKAGGNFGPNKEMICTTCHLPHKGVKNTPLLVAVNNQSSICLDCHKDKKSVIYSDHNLAITAPDEPNIRNQTAAQSGVCAPCHFSHGWAKKLSGEGDFVTQLCVSCHNKDGSAKNKPIDKYSHPTDKSIKKADGTSSMPLFDEMGKQKPEGNVLCTSCHDPHVWDPKKLDTTFNKNREGDFTNSFLRKPNNAKSEFCKDCHEDKFFVENTEHDMSVTAPNAKNIEGKTSSEGGICSACHLVHNGKERKIWAREVSQIGKDTSANLCFSCHSEKNPGEAKKIVTFTHPTSVSILGADGNSTLPLFNNKGELLENGSVYCNTCHDPHTWDPSKKKVSSRKNTEGNQTNSFLRISNFPSPDLCKDCHGKKVLVEGTDHDLANTAPKVKNFEDNTRKTGGLCSPCHVVHNGLGPRMWSREISGDADFSSKFCFSCHADGKCAEKKQLGKFSHPVDVSISKAGGITTLPTFNKEAQKQEGGNVYCYSCHDPHIWDPKKNTKGEAKENIEGTALNSFLRLPSDPEATLCRDCHGAQGLIVETDHDLKVSAPKEKNMLGQTVFESGPCGACHVPHNAVAEKLWAKQKGKGTDSISPLCESCHGKNGCGNTKQIGETHPVGVDFSRLGFKGEPPFPIFTLQGAKDMETGKVLCSTCHNLHQWDPDKKEHGPGIKVEGDITNSFLRKNNKNSDMCTGCHLNKKYVVRTEHDMRITAPSEKNVINQTAEEGGPCSACHIPHNAFGKLLIWAKLPQASLETPSMLCKSCHAPKQCAENKVPVVDMHPADIVVTNIGRRNDREPGSLPMFNKDDGLRAKHGIVSCGSCHNPHQWEAGNPNNAPGENTEGTASNSFLRQKDFTICADCHRFDALFRYKYYHIPRIREIGRGLE